MRIVQAAGWYAPDSLGGTELYVAALSDRLRRLGHDVLVAAPDAAHTSERHYAHDGIPVYRYPIPESITRDEARGFALVRGAERFHRWLSSAHADVVHVHTFVTGLGLAEVAAARAAGSRVIVTSHSASLGFLCERGTMLRLGRALCDGVAEPIKCATCALQKRGVPPWAGALASRVERVAPASVDLPGRVGTLFAMPSLIRANMAAQERLFSLVDAFVVLSRWAAEALMANGAPPEKVVLNRLGVAPRIGGWPAKAPPQQAPSTSPITVGYVGRAEDIKGLEDFVRAVVLMKKAVPIQARVVALASGEHERTILERCRRLAARDARVVFEDPVNPHKIPALLASLDVLVCPSRALEGGPTIALEAHAVGTPVVGSAIPALSELIRDGVNGALYPPGDVRRLTGLLTELAHDPARIDTWRTQLPAVRLFDAVTAEYLRLYQA